MSETQQEQVADPKANGVSNGVDTVSASAGVSATDSVVETPAASAEAATETAPVEPATEEPGPNPEFVDALRKQFHMMIESAPVATRSELKKAMSAAILAETASPRGEPASTTQAAPSVAAPATTPAAPAVEVAQPTQPAAVAATPVDPTLGVTRKFKVTLPAGFKPEPPGLLYTAAANDYRAFEGLAVDVVQWGGHMAIVFLPGTDMRVVLPDGSPYEVVEHGGQRQPIVIPVDGDFTNVARDLMERPDDGIVISIHPSIQHPLSDGTIMTRHFIGRGELIPKKGIWPPE